MKRQAIGAILLLLLLGLTGCASDGPTPTAQPTTQAPTQAPSQEPTQTPTAAPTTQAPTASPEATTLGPTQDGTAGGTPGTGGALKDGEYRAEMSKDATEASSGWQGYLTLTVSGGDVTQAEFDYLKDEKKKSEATAEEYPMNPPPSEWIPTYQQSVLKAGSTGQEIDVVSGATQSAKDVNALYQAALDAAREGNTQTVTVEQTQQSGSAS